MRTSDQINELAGALAKAQAVIKNATLNKTNPHFRSRYADLAAVRDAVTGPLAENGLSLLQGMSQTEGALLVHTRLVHTSGQWIESVYPIINDVAKPQAMGSALTYARRYSLAALCNIASEEDDDGQSAQEHGKKNGNGHAPPDTGELTGNPNVKGYKPPATATSQAANEARAAAEYYKLIERQIDEIKTEGDLDDWFAEKREEMNARLAKSYVPTVRDKLAEKREELANARVPA